MDLFVAGRDQSAADQPNNLAEGHPPLQPLYNLRPQVGFHWWEMYYKQKK